MIKSDVAGDFLDFSLGNVGGWSAEGAWCSSGWSASTESDLLFSTSNTQTINIQTPGLWLFKQYTIMTTEFEGLGFLFKSAPSSTATIYIDRIEIYEPNREIHEANVVQANIKITGDGVVCNVNLNDYDTQANDQMFEYDKKIRALEAVQEK
jgi:hypothetical protein